MLGISVSKFHKLIPVVENKDLHRLLARLEQTPSESHIQNSTRHTTLLWGWTNFFNDDWQVDGDRATVLKHQSCSKTHFSSHVTILLINLSSMGLPIGWRHIHSMFEPVEVSIHDVQIYSVCMIYPGVLIWRCNVSFDVPSSSDSLRVLFLKIFFQNSAYILNIP